MENLKNLEKIAKIFQPQNIITSEEIDQVLKGIMEILASYKKGTDAINEETKAVVNILLDKVVQSNKQTIDKAEIMFDDRMTDLETLLKDVKQMITDVETLASEVKDGKDADEEKIVEDVISRIKIDPTVVTVSAQEIKDKLSSLEGDNKLDISAVKGFELYSTKVDLDYAIKTLQHQTSFLINRGGVKSLTAGTNITITDNGGGDYTIASSGGGTPGGSTTQLQYNNAGAFGGISGATTDGTAVTYTAGNLIAADITASGSGGLLLQSNNGTDALLIGAGGGAGATFYGGVNIAGELTVDTNTLYVDATNNRVGVGTTSPTYQLSVIDSTAATTPRFWVGRNFLEGVGIAVSDNDLYIKYKQDETGSVEIHKYIQDIETPSTAAHAFEWRLNNSTKMALDVKNTFLGIGTSAPTHSLTLNSTSTGIALYNTSDQTTNYERVQMYWTGNVYTIQTQKGGSGSNRNLTIGTVSRVLQFLESPTGTQGFYTFSNSTGGSLNALSITTTRSNSASVAAELTIQPTYNQSSTAGYTCLLINPTETTTGSGSKLLADFQVGGSSKAKIDNTGLITAPQVINTPATITVTSNAGTVTRDNRVNNFTNSSAATMTITMSTTSAADGDIVMVRIKDFSAVAQTITWVNTENSSVSVPATSNGSTTLPLTVGFQYNSATSLWRCIMNV